MVVMTQNTIKVWIWIHNDRLYKAISNPATKTITIYDADDKILIRRTGLTIQQIKTIELTLDTCGARRMDGHKQPFTYL
jgi:hypothetical protein